MRTGSKTRSQAFILRKRWFLDFLVLGLGLRSLIEEGNTHRKFFICNRIYHKAFTSLVVYVADRIQLPLAIF